ncbi:MAG TPA: hypothetical protein VGE07_05770 [Herpetosiphonaceae bacterium]
MHCPQCGAAADTPPAGCPRCCSFLDPAAIDLSSAAVPLNDAQRRWLRANAALPTCFLLFALAALGAMGACILGRFAGTPFFAVAAAVAGLIVAGVVLATGLHVLNNYLDLRRGVAEAAVARLVGRRTSGSSPRTLYGEFEGVGALIIPLANVYEQLAEGRAYRIFYSRRTRRLWTVVPA